MALFFAYGFYHQFMIETEKEETPARSQRLSRLLNVLSIQC